MPPKRLYRIAFASCLLVFGAGAANAQDLGPVAASVFERIDANSDGLVTRNEVLASRAEMFDRLDENGDGALTEAEAEAVRSRAQSRRAERLARWAERRARAPSSGERFAALDENRDGAVSREEFVNRANLRFDHIDTGGNGLTREDFAAFLDGAG